VQRIQAAQSDYEQLETYRQNLTDYVALASPTAAQAAGALKILIKVVLAMLDYLRRN
jgi:hypothetical protein